MPVIRYVDIDTELAKQTQDIESRDDYIEAGFESLDSLGELGQFISGKLDQEDPLTSREAELIAITMESIRIRLGMPETVGRIPSLESFRSKKYKLNSSQVTLESVGEFLRSVWEGIVRFMQAIWDKLVEFFTWLFGMREKAEQRNNELEQKAELTEKKSHESGDKMIGQVPHLRLIKDQQLANYFSIDGKANEDTVQVLIDRYNLLVDHVLTSVKSMDETLVDLRKGLNKDYQTEEGINTHIQSVNALTERLKEKFNDKALGLTRSDKIPGRDIITIGPLPGALLFQFSFMSNEPHIVQPLRSLQMSMIPYEKVSEEIEAISNIQQVKHLLSKLKHEIINTNKLRSDVRTAVGMMRMTLIHMAKESRNALPYLKAEVKPGTIQDQLKNHDIEQFNRVNTSYHELARYSMELVHIVSKLLNYLLSTQMVLINNVQRYCECSLKLESEVSSG